LRLSQPATWKWLNTGDVAPEAPRACPVTLIELQLVGFRTNPGRSILATIERIRSGTPSTICGIGSVFTVTWAVLLSRKTAARTTTLPRSNGPATAGVMKTSDNGAPLYGPARYALPFT